MSVVFEDLDPGGPPPSSRRPRRWLPVLAGVVALTVVAVLVQRGGDDRPSASPTPSVAPTFTPSSATVSFIPVPGGRVTVGTGSALPVVLMSAYGLPGLTVYGRTGWRLESAGSNADQVTYTAVDPASGALRPTVTLGVLDRAPLPTIEAEQDRRTRALVAAGASAVTSVQSAFEDVIAADLGYDAPGGRVVEERVWLHAGVALFVRVSDDAAHPGTVSTLFAETVQDATTGS